MGGCETAAGREAREAVERPAAWDWLLLRGHRLVCGHCRRLHRQLRWIDAVLAARPDAGPPMPAAARDRIVRAVEETSGGL